ncbi:peptide chain release factor N(5)-glutamine methyltransferase, partial [bacterium]|nr:peptide chain release factor N(5)-glutamine methyltransferase [bacterium]
AITLAKHIKDCIVYGLDISDDALLVAKKNVIDNGLDKKVFLFKNDLLSGITKHFDIIVSNPPYVLSKEMKDLPLNVLFEPKIALDGGDDGLLYYKQIIKQAKNCLKENGILAFEIHEQKADALKQLAKENKFDTVTIIKDYNNKDRFVFIY